MSFLKIADPVKREQTVKEFLVIKKNIRANELAEKTGKIELQTDLSEFFKPVTETQKETQKETQRAITSGLRPIRKGLKPIKGLKGIKTAIEELPQRLPPQQKTVFYRPHPTFEEKPFSPPYFAPPLTSSAEEEEEEEVEEEEEEPSTSKEGEKKNYDTTFGFYTKGDRTFLGDKLASFDEENIYIGDKTFKNTQGLWSLIMDKIPIDSLIKKKDKKDYSDILDYTNTMHRDNNPLDPYPKASKSLKWRIFVKPAWDDLQKKLEKKKTTGKGLKKVVIPSDPNALLEKLDLLMASKAAGNTDMRNELVSVCDELKRQGIFDSEIYKKIMSVL